MAHVVCMYTTTTTITQPDGTSAVITTVSTAPVASAPASCSGLARGDVARDGMCSGGTAPEPAAVAAGGDGGARPRRPKKAKKAKKNKAKRFSKEQKQLLEKART